VFRAVGQSGTWAVFDEVVPLEGRNSGSHYELSCTFALRCAVLLTFVLPGQRAAPLITTVMYVCAVLHTFVLPGKRSPPLITTVMYVCAVLHTFVLPRQRSAPLIITVMYVCAVLRCAAHLCTSWKALCSSHHLIQRSSLDTTIITWYNDVSTPQPLIAQYNHTCTPSPLPISTHREKN
jgi:hypothetical protein